MSLQDTEKSLAKFKDELVEKSNSLFVFIRDSELFLAKLKRDKELLQENMEEASANLSKVFGDVDPALLKKFLSRPYKTKQFYNARTKQTYYEVYVPKWVPKFSIGWRKAEADDTETFWTYVVNQYSIWLGEVPEQLAKLLDFGHKNTIAATVKDGIVKFPKEQKAIAEEMFKGHVTKWDLDCATIKQGSEFDIILKIVRSGRIPYAKIPVQESDKRKSSIKFKPYSYQVQPVKRFFETGATGVFHPMGSGKSYVGIYCADQLVGKKIIVTGKSMIKQWEYYFEKECPRLLEETDIVTYELLRARPQYFENEYVLGIFDECHRLPAGTFVKSSTLKVKYRLGLSASPHREDGNEDLIYALTGWPEGINWKEYYEQRGRKQHPIYVHLVRNPSQKMSVVRRLLNLNKKTIIQVQRLEVGHAIAKEFSIPFIHGETKERLEIVKKNRVVVGSSVLDLGVSLPDLQRLIEVDFLFGSRMQELQRTGRLGHSDAAERHDIIMTDQEYEEYGKRIWVLEDYGFHVTIEGQI